MIVKFGRTDSEQPLS